LKQQASQDSKKRVAVPYVLLSADGRIAGYFTLSSTNIRIDDLPLDLLKQLRLPRYPAVGATLLGRLARDLSFRGHGVGELLLVHALKLSLLMSRKIASVGVVVDAKDEHASQFYRDFGFVAFSDPQSRLLLRMEAVEKLFPVG